MSFVANTQEQRAAMLDVCGVDSIDSLFETIPEALRPQSFNIPAAKSELEVIDALGQLAERNYTQLTNFIGGGYYDSGHVRAKAGHGMHRHRESWRPRPTGDPGSTVSGLCLWRRVPRG
jgi:hypothetical protein